MVFCGLTFFLFHLLSLTLADEYCVSSSDNSSNCTDNCTCHNFSFYIDNSEDYFTDNTIFYFLEGTHILNQDELVVISDISNLTLQGMGTVKQGFHETVRKSTVQITCSSNKGGLAFINVTNLDLSGITIVKCGAPPVTDIIFNTTFSLPLFKFYDYTLKIKNSLLVTLLYDVSLCIINVQGLKMDNFGILNGTGFGLIAVNAFNTTVYNSTFSGNNFYSTVLCRINASSSKCSGGNAVFAYVNPQMTIDHKIMEIFHLTIKSSNFSFGYNLNSTIYFGGGGLSIYMEQTACFGIDVTLDDIVAYENVGGQGSNIIFITSEALWYYTFNIINSISTRSNWLYTQPGWEEKTFLNTGGGLNIILGISFSSSQPKCTCRQIPIVETPISITNSSFVDNIAVIGAGVYIDVMTVPLSYQKLELQSCDLSNNHGYLGIGLYITQNAYTTFGVSVEYVLNDINMINSKVFSPPSLQLVHKGTVIFMSTLARVVIKNILVTDNSPNGGALITNSLIIFSGNNIFQNNTSDNGGAVSMYGATYFVLTPPATLKFIDNHANKEGGAIYIDHTTTLSSFCFFQIQDASFSQNPDVQWIFSGNTAGISGSAIYGGTVNNCSLLPLSYPTSFNTSREVFNNTFYFTNQTGFSVVSSNAFQVCFCEGNTTDCKTTSVYYNAIPGEFLVLRLATVGDLEGLSPGVIKIKQSFNGSNLSVSDPILIPSQPTCFDYSYVVRYNSNIIDLIFSVHPLNDRVDVIIQYPTISVSISLLPCPPGFQLSSEYKVCDCNSKLTQTVENITCNVSSQQITKQGNVWIGYDNRSECLLVASLCPYDYCIAESTTITVTSPNPQCAHNRAGILCGQCAEGLSLMLGSNQCGQCTDDYLALIIPFALAGIVLVGFLIALNLTVSVGTINGLIFFANVIKINETVFFPSGPVPFLSQFISWLNLDLGIKTCFYNGLTSYSKAWLQFLFPFYIWFLIILLIILCRYISRLARAIGHNVMPVFATLILLSYIKLFRVIVPILQFITVPCVNTNETVNNKFYWAVDANVPYGSSNHIVLLLFAVFVFFGLCLPYTLILLLQPLGRAKLRCYRCDSLCLWLKPLFDAYYGPYKTNLRIWTSLLLIARLVLVIVAAVGDEDSYIFVTIILIAFLLSVLVVVSGVYKKRWLNYIECWFHFILIVLMSLVKETPSAAIFVTSAAFLTFFGILCYHIFIQILRRCETRYIRFKTKRYAAIQRRKDTKHGSLMNSLVEDVEVTVDRQNVPTTVVERHQKREPLLFDESGGNYSAFEDSSKSLI